MAHNWPRHKGRSKISNTYLNYNKNQGYYKKFSQSSKFWRNVNHTQFSKHMVLVQKHYCKTMRQPTYAPSPLHASSSSDLIMGEICHLVDQMTKKNFWADGIQNFIMKTIRALIEHKQGKKVMFSNQMLSQRNANPNNVESLGETSHHYVN